MNDAAQEQHIRDVLAAVIAEWPERERVDLAIGGVSIHTTDEGEHLVHIEMLFDQLPDGNAMNDFFYRLREKLIEQELDMFPILRFPDQPHRHLAR